MRKGIVYILFLSLFLLSFSGCEQIRKTSTTDNTAIIEGTQEEAASKEMLLTEEKDYESDWFEEEREKEEELAIIPLQELLGEDKVLASQDVEGGASCYYMVSVAQFRDSNGDGIGDVNGIVNTIDYIKDLGCDGICLLDAAGAADGVANIADYAQLNGLYGTEEEFVNLMRVCEERGIAVLVSMNLNEIASVVNIDLSNDVIRTELAKMYVKWMDKGVDGFYFAECNRYQPGEDSANMEFLSWSQQVCQEKKEDFVIIGEVFDNLETCNRYYESGVDSFTNGRFSGEYGIIARSILTYAGDYSGIVLADKICELQPNIEKHNVQAVPSNILSNKKQGRSADYFHYNEMQTKLAGAISLLMSGNSFVLYGEELGMGGAMVDENVKTPKVRNVLTPMYWLADSADENMDFLGNEDSKQEYNHRFGSYEEQREDALSIYNYYRQVLQVRHAFPSIANGKQERMEALGEGAVCGIMKTTANEKCYIVINTHNQDVSVDVPKSIYYYQDLEASISVDENEVLLEGETLVLPPYGIAVLK